MNIDKLPTKTELGRLQQEREIMGEHETDYAYLVFQKYKLIYHSNFKS